jgi:hypothetical protein
MGDEEHDNPLPGDYPEPEADPEPATAEENNAELTGEIEIDEAPAETLRVTPLTEETPMANAIQQTATAKEKADAEHYIFSLGHSHEDAEKYAARIGHKKVLEHQLAGRNPLREKDED